MIVNILPFGPSAVLLETASTAAAADLAGWLRAIDVEGIEEIVPAARTVLVRCDSESSRRTVESSLSAREPDFYEPATARLLIEIGVVYDGEDLLAVASSIGLEVNDVVHMHSSITYRAAFCGFAPGFTYLIGLDPRLHLPRRPAPRARVPAGSVAIASEFTAVYPSASPGGWHLLGRTDVVMFDMDRAEPATIPPGSHVRFVPR